MSTEIADRVPQTYLAFSLAFSYPSPDLWGEGENLIGLLQNNGVAVLPSGAVHPSSPAPLEQLEAEYICCFEVGGDGRPPCPLYEGLCRRDEDRVGIMEELLRFYDFFGLRLSQAHRDYPDHLSTELEFLGYLASAEAQAGEREATPFRLAQRDFLVRHLGQWLPILQSWLDQFARTSFYHQLCSCLCQFVNGEKARLEGCLVGGGNENPKG